MDDNLMDSLPDGDDGDVTDNDVTDTSEVVPVDPADQEDTPDDEGITAADYYEPDESDDPGPDQNSDPNSDPDAYKNKDGTTEVKTLDTVVVTGTRATDPVVDEEDTPDDDGITAADYFEPDDSDSTETSTDPVDPIVDAGGYYENLGTDEIVYPDDSTSGQTTSTQPSTSTSTATTGTNTNTNSIPSYSQGNGDVANTTVADTSVVPAEPVDPDDEDTPDDDGITAADYFEPDPNDPNDDPDAFKNKDGTTEIKVLADVIVKGIRRKKTTTSTQPATSTQPSTSTANTSANSNFMTWDPPSNITNINVASSPPSWLFPWLTNTSTQPSTNTNAVTNTKPTGGATTVPADSGKKSGYSTIGIDKHFTKEDAIEGLKVIYNLYGRTIANEVEQIYNLETTRNNSHFASGQYIHTGSGGMEPALHIEKKNGVIVGHKYASGPYYGYTADIPFWKANPQYAPIGVWSAYENKGASGNGGQQQITSFRKEFIVFPSVTAAMLAKAEYIKKYNGNFARWGGLDPDIQANYRKQVLNQSHKIVDSF